MIRLAIDCMGGDHGPPVTLAAARGFTESHVDCQCLLVGKSEQIEPILARWPAALRERAKLVAASQVIEMDDPPAQALRGKKDSSMRVAIEQVKSGQADACVSAGNTGALMAISRSVLKTLEGIDRPAIASQLPNRRGGTTTMLDLGANVDCTPEQLLQFAVMGAALVNALEGRERPSIGLLNIGEEVIKGNEVVKQAGELLRGSNLNVFGNVEGDDIYKGTVDVVVCDGFVGNVALKTSEGVATMLGEFLKSEFSRNPLTRLLALLCYPVLRGFKRRVDHRRYNGASLVGLRGVVIKSHGSADALSFEFALKRAYDAAHNGLIGSISGAMARLAPSSSGGELPPPAAANVADPNQPLAAKVA